MKNIEIIDVDSKNISQYGFYCVQDSKHVGYQAKLNWCKKRFAEGLKLKLLYSTPEKKAVGFIEYVPGEFAWRGVDAKGYEFIHCILLMLNKYKNKGYAKFKEDLAKVIIKGLSPFQKKMKTLENKPAYLRKVLDQGAKDAKKIAEKTLKEVKGKMGLI